MRFTQRYWFTEVSDQAQTRDLFRLQRMHLGNDDLYKELRGEIFDMVQYLDSDALREQRHHPSAHGGDDRADGSTDRLWG